MTRKISSKPYKAGLLVYCYEKNNGAPVLFSLSLMAKVQKESAVLKRAKHRTLSPILCC